MLAGLMLPSTLIKYAMRPAIWGVAYENIRKSSVSLVQ